VLLGIATGAADALATALTGVQAAQHDAPDVTARRVLDGPAATLGLAENSLNLLVRVPWPAG
jgi:hypothetical protein